MGITKTPIEPKKKPTFLRQYLRALRFYFITGLLVWVPLIVTVWIAWWLFKSVGLGLEGLIQRGYGTLHEVGDRIPQLSFLTGFTYVRGFGFLIAAALFLTTGFLTRSLVARRLIRAIERLFDRIPLISRIYRAVQQIRDVFITRRGTIFQKVVLIEYPRPGIWAPGFLVSREPGEIQRVLGTDLLGVFVPSVPNPTQGFLVYLPADKVIETTITVEECMKLVFSAGAYIPGGRSNVDQDQALESENAPQ